MHPSLSTERARVVAAEDMVECDAASSLIALVRFWAVKEGVRNTDYASDVHARLVDPGNALCAPLRAYKSRQDRVRTSDHG